MHASSAPCTDIRFTAAARVASATPYDVQPPALAWAPWLSDFQACPVLHPLGPDVALGKQVCEILGSTILTL